MDEWSMVEREMGGESKKMTWKKKDVNCNGDLGDQKLYDKPVLKISFAEGL